MGNILKKNPEKVLNKQIEQDQKKKKRRDGQIIKVLLLGTGDSGKSTIFRQAQHFMKTKFDEQEIQDFAQCIYDNIFRQAGVFVLSARKAGMVPEDDESLNKAINYVLSIDLEKMKTEFGVTQEYKQAISTIWQHEAMQRVWERRVDFPFFDCVEYFFDEKVISRIASQGKAYRPTIDDIMHFRNKTTGVVHQSFRYKSGNFELYDVGGQRSERRKWLNCFANVNTILFVVAINEYDQRLYEDENVMRMDEALKVWYDVANREVFRNMGFLLFLNKYDLFVEKVKRYPFRVLDGPSARNTDYMGPDPMLYENGSKEQAAATENCASYIADKFQQGIVDPDMREGHVNIYRTVATSVETFKYIFDSCLQQILFSSLGLEDVT